MSAANAAGVSDYKMKHLHWHFDGMRGTYDRAAMQRGYQVYREVCSACHQLEHLAFRHLGDKGAPFYDKHFKNPNDNPLVKGLAADWLVEDIDIDTGDVIERKAIPDGTDATVEQMSKDVTEFLAWSADPKMEARKSLGLATMLYLLILSILLWFAYKSVWRNVKH